MSEGVHERTESPESPPPEPVASPPVIATTTQPLATLEPEPAAQPLATLEPDPAAQPLATLAPQPVATRRVDHLLRTWASEPTPMPEPTLHAASFVWGLAQPLLGLRTLWQHRDLLARAILPVLGFVGVCLVAARGEPGLSWVAAYYLTLITAAPLSPVLFCRHYARLAATARTRLGLEPRDPYLRTARQILGEFFVQGLVVGVGIAPLVGLVAALPLLGPIWAAALGYLWALHWIVVEAFDSAKTLAPGEIEPTHAIVDRPWFARPADWQLDRGAALVTLPIRLWARVVGRLAKRWRTEVAILERHPWMAAGFGLGAAVLLALPVLNLVFRPAIVIAATHVLGRTEAHEPAQILPTNLA